ncbi:AAA family ATPase [Novosphingobium sp.]|uniref:AAA family ATPase n=1 Tax=Novosphingobium sp. TaxID=1874826 RepID=UPI0026235BAE|nr:AAA family ATPase [Novosphingobium sp.]
MTVDRIHLLRNIGQFDSVTAGAQLALTPLTLVYAENGRGKTTLATILRSLSTGDAALIEDRRRLGAAHPPHIVLSVAGAALTYQNGGWRQPTPRVAVFDDNFVAENVCAGIEIESSHRQNLHELILGAQGVALNAEVQRHVAAIEQHIRDLRQKEAAIPTAQRGSLTVEAFCALPQVADIDLRIQEADRNLAAANAADAIRRRDEFLPIAIPSFDIPAIQALLGRTLADVKADAAGQVRDHLRRLGRGGEAWIGEGLPRIAGVSEGHDHDVCPFCEQDLAGSPIIAHYDAYFSEAYNDLKAAIIDTGKATAADHGGEIQSAFERSIRIAGENAVFWRNFMELDAVAVDTAAIMRRWSAARDAVLAILRTKAAAPLEPMELSEDAVAFVEAYEADVADLAELSASIVRHNAQIAIIKEQAAAANVAALTSDLERARAIQRRHTPPLNAACDAYLAEKDAKTRTEQLRDQARDALNQYRDNIFPTYQRAINDYLTRFSAGFRLDAVTSVNTRAGSSASYNVLINNVAVALSAPNGGPSFRTTLSAGDRNTLALAFFFASLEHNPSLADTILVIDDPMTSLDEHRSLTTVEEVRGIARRVRQVIVLSHSKPFLCAMWADADTQLRSAIRINRDGNGSTLAAWDVNQDCITEHDRRHAMVSEYIRAANAASERAVAQALRPILEAFLRVAYPADFPPGKMLGPFIAVCRQRLGQANQIMGQSDIDELDRLRNYANRFHHDSNPAWQTAQINDQELAGFARRVLTFASLR